MEADVAYDEDDLNEVDSPEEDREISELCDQLAAQPLWCGEENVMILQCSFDVTRRMLGKGPAVKQRDLVRHVDQIKGRYKTMLRDVPDWLECERLKPHAQSVLVQDDPILVLLSAFYIDHEFICLCNLAACGITED